MGTLPQISPMTLSRLRDPFDHPDWIFELKHDGFRALAYISEGECRLVSRRRNVYKSFAPLNEALARMGVQNAILDGEIVCLDETGRSIFSDVMFRRGEPIFYAFDLLRINGVDLRGLPLLQRKGRLRELLDAHQLERVLFAKHVEERGVDFYWAVCQRDCEGIVAKRKDSTYSPGTRTWIKIKNPYYTQAEGRREMFDEMRQRRSTTHFAPAD